MKTINVEIEGTSPLLFAKPPIIIKKGRKTKTIEYTPENDAQNLNCCDEEIGCYIPSEMISACIREAGKNFKNGKSTMAKLIVSSTVITPDKIPLNKPTYDYIDSRFARQNMIGLTKSRPAYKSGWKVNFVIMYDENVLDSTLLKNMLEIGGNLKCLGSYRPRFGRFRISKFDEV